MIGYHLTLLGTTDLKEDLKKYLSRDYDGYRAYMGDSFSELYPLLSKRNFDSHAIKCAQVLKIIHIVASYADVLVGSEEVQRRQHQHNIL